MRPRAVWAVIPKVRAWQFALSQLQRLVLVGVEHSAGKIISGANRASVSVALVAPAGIRNAQKLHQSDLADLWGSSDCQNRQKHFREFWQRLSP